MRRSLLPLIVSVLATSQPNAAEQESLGPPEQNNEIANAIGNLQMRLDTLNDQLMDCAANTPKRFTDNGDGTVCDRDTGLMWEKKNGADGRQDLTNPHDVDNLYTWTARLDYTNPDGTLFTDFLPRLNGVIASSQSSEQLGGYNDWRIPTSAELQTIVDCSFELCIDTDVFGDVGYFYWSSTSLASFAGEAWCVFFRNGPVFSQPKGHDGQARAVRGGR